MSLARPLTSSAVKNTDGASSENDDENVDFATERNVENPSHLMDVNNNLASVGPDSRNRSQDTIQPSIPTTTLNINVMDRHSANDSDLGNAPNNNNNHNHHQDNAVEIEVVGNDDTEIEMGESSVIPTSIDNHPTAVTGTSSAHVPQSPPESLDAIIMPSNEELLLRDWTSSTPENQAGNRNVNESQGDEEEENMPVAPAVVVWNESTSSERQSVEDRHQGRPVTPPPPPTMAATSTTVLTPNTSGTTATVEVATSTPTTYEAPSSASRYAYPVATFVSNFVRSSVNEIRDHIIAATAVPADSVRSAPGSMITTAVGSHPVAAAGDAGDRGNDNEQPRTRFLSEEEEENERNGADNSTEYVLIDGDLVAIPAIHEQYMNDYDARPGRQQRQERRQQRRQQIQQQSIQRRSNSRGNLEQDNDGSSLLNQQNSASAANSHAAAPTNNQPGYTQSLNDMKMNSSSSVSTLSSANLAGGSRTNHHSRVQRGMRKVKKWMKKKQILPKRKSGLGHHTDTTSNSSQQIPQDTSLVSQSSHAFSTHQSSEDSRAFAPSNNDPNNNANVELSVEDNPPPSHLKLKETKAQKHQKPSKHKKTSHLRKKSPPRKNKRKKGRRWLRDNPPQDDLDLQNDALLGYDGTESQEHIMGESDNSVASRPFTVLSPNSPAPTSFNTTASDMIPPVAGPTNEATRQNIEPTHPLQSTFSDALHDSRQGSLTLDVPPLIPGHRRSESASSALLAAGASILPLENEPPSFVPPPIPGHRRSDSASSALLAAGASILPLENEPPSFVPPPMPGHRRSDSASSALLAASASVVPLEHESPSINRQASIAAEYVGYAGEGGGVIQGGVLPENIIPAEAYIEDRLDDYDKYGDEKKEGMLYGHRSMVPTDFKVDKLDAPCVDSMLRRAGEFVDEALEDESNHMPIPAAASFRTKGKSDGESIPLSMATRKDTFVHNDTLKLVMVGDAQVDKTSLARALRKSTKKPRKRRTTLGVDVHSWTLPNDDRVKFSIWDVQGVSREGQSSNVDFGSHPGTQSLFFSDRALYLLVWDLAVSNKRTYRRDSTEQHAYSDNEDEDDEEDENEYLREEANRQADRALHADIEERVLTWVDCIAHIGPHSAILPVALVSGNMSPEEAKRRCDTMQTVMMQHTERMQNAPKVLSGAETVLCVSLETNMGMDLLQETILAIATDVTHSVFDHVGTPVPLGTTIVLETCKRMKQDHKLVLVDHLLAELSLLKNEIGMILSVDEVMVALHFLASIGECLYFGGLDDVLSHYVILSRRWLVGALSCILRNDLKRELIEMRRFMNIQSLYSDHRFPENPVSQAFSNGTSNCPLLSSIDTQMLWQSMSFMKEAADLSSKLTENNTTSSTMFGFLEHLLVHTGVFLPLDIDRFASPDVVYFVPSLLAQADTRDVWTYKSSDAWITTLAHSWLFRNPSMERDSLMEHVTVALLRDLYEFSHVVASKPRSPPSRAQTFPLNQNSLTDFIDDHDGEAIGHIKIHQMMCWKNSLLIKIGCMFPEATEVRESFVEIFVTIADPSSPHCVASDAMQSSMQRLIVSAKGQVGHHGRKLWRGGYRVVLDSIKTSVADCTNVDLQVVCPECLAQSHPSSASTWSWDAVRAAAETGSSIVRCMRGHRADSNLICGTIRPAGPKSEGIHTFSEGPTKPVKELLPSVVLVGLYDPKTASVKNVGSGFIADKKQGLVVTAGHVLFDMKPGRDFGIPYYGVKNARIVIAVIREEKAQSNISTASFRYFADIVADDIHSMDACVLKITSRFENDIEDESLIGVQQEKEIMVNDEHLPSLKTTRRFELEETVRILGFNQAGEGWLEQGKHVNRVADFAKGYICKQFKLADDNSDSDSDSDDSSSSEVGFSPREEIVIMCPTIPGHSGGPCVNAEGKVVGILSRADPVDRQRCYLVPASEVKILMNKARKSSSRVAGLKRPY